jgi:hypothetical protein
MKYDIIISINVHNNPEYLLKQIENINEFVPLKKRIILNCNDFMFDHMKNLSIPDVEIFPEPLNKKTFHGSLTHGVACNMSHALNTHEFDYFLVMSSRDVFYRVLDDTSQIEKHIVNEKNIQIGDVDFGVPNFYKSGHYCQVHGDHVPWQNSKYLPFNKHLDRVNIWWWPKFSRTKLYQYIKNNNMSFAHSMHEGVCFRYDGCEYIMNFFQENEDIMYELFNFDGCVEEFALQSIASNFKGFYYIGNGCDTKSDDEYNDYNLEQLDPTKFTYKRKR